MPIFTAIAAAIGLTGFFATAVATVLEIGTAIGVSYIAKALAGNPTTNTQSSGNSNFGMQGTLQAAGDTPRSFPVGDCATAGSLAYGNYWGTSGSTPNAYLTQVIALSDLPGCSLTGLWVNGQKVTIGATDTGFGKPITEYNKAGVDHLWVRFYDGTQTTADSFLTGSVSSTERPYQSTRVGKGVAYAIVTALTEDTLFTGFPSFLFEMGGIKLYDPTKDSTNGGSGSQVYSDSTTWGGDGDKFPAVQLYNLLRGFRYNGTWLYGLQNMTQARLPTVNWNSQIGKCRTTIAGPSGAEPTYRSGGQIAVNQQVVNCAEAMLTACQGRLSEIGGFYKVHLGTPDSSSFSFTDDDILSTEIQTFAPFLPLASSVNGLTATYPDPAQSWQMTAAPPLYNSTYETADGSRRLLANPTLDLVPYAAQAQRLMKSALLEARRERQHAITLPPTFWIVEPGDVCSWTSTRNGYSAKQFRVDGTIDKANLDTQMSLTEVDPTDYSWNQATDYQTPTTGPTSYPRPAPQGVVSWFATGAVVNDSSGSPRRPAISLSWDGTIAGVIGVQFEVRLTADSSHVARGRTDQLTAGTLLISQSLLPNTPYQVRGQYIPSAPRDMLWSTWLDVTTPDIRLTIADFADVLIAQINAISSFDSTEILAAINLIASIAANQDARNWLDKKEVRGQLDSVAGNAKASIATLQQTMVDQQTAFASYQVTVSATFGASFSSVSSVSSAVATLNGYAAAEYAVTLDVNGYASGFNLVNGGGGISSFTVLANLFQVAAPGVIGGAPVPMFTIANVGGTPKIAFRGDMYADGTITVNKLNVATLSAITADLGTITTGLIQSPDGKFVIDATNKRITISD